MPPLQNLKFLGDDDPWLSFEQPLCSQVCPSLFPSAPSPVHSSDSIPLMSPLTDCLVFPSPFVWLSFQLPILLLSSCLASHTSPYVDMNSSIHIAAHPPSAHRKLPPILPFILLHCTHLIHLSIISSPVHPASHPSAVTLLFFLSIFFCVTIHLSSP